MSDKLVIYYNIFNLKFFADSVRKIKMFLICHVTYIFQNQSFETKNRKVETQDKKYIKI